MPAAVADATAIDRHDPAGWVAADLPAPLPGPSAAAEPTAAGNDDRSTRPADRSPDPPADPGFAAGHPTRESVRLFFRQTERAADRGIVWTLGLQALSREWLSIPLDAVRTGVDGLQLLGCRTPHDVLALQAALMRSGVAQALARGDRIASLSAQILAQTLAPASDRTGDGG